MSPDTGFFSRQDLACEPASIRRARDHASQTLTSWGVPEGAVFDALTVVSELATNAVRHAAVLVAEAASSREQSQRSFYSVLLRATPGYLYVTVWDESPTPPVLRSASEYSETGRGLQLVSALCRGSWGFEPSPTGPGKHVWAALQTASGVQTSHLAESALARQPAPYLPFGRQSRRGVSL
jgi:anti-sigma regulatory factor (Ser/Thr protein kinase)